MAELNASAIRLDGLLRLHPRYSNKTRVKTDILSVLRYHMNTLLPKDGKLTLNGGQECKLIMLEGTLPTFYKGVQYNTPIEIYIREDYPTSPPMCYVRPTSGMSLKPKHRHVDNSGLVYLPYLHEWGVMTHNLVELCAHMSSVFGADPPVYQTPVPQSRRLHTPPADPPAYQSPYLRQPSSHTRSQARLTPDLPPKPRPEDERRKKEQTLTAKLQGELKEIHDKLGSDMDAALKNQTRLKEDQLKMDADVAELIRRKAELERLLKETRERRSALDEYLDEKEKEGEPDVTDLIEPRDALSDQMLILVAEDAALEDCLYYLDKGVTDGVITMDVFLREVRRLARKQFIARATSKRVEEEQQCKRTMKATSVAQQQHSQNQTIAYPRLPPAQQGAARGLLYMGSPPPYRADAPPAYSGPSPYLLRGVPSHPAAGSTGQWGGNTGVAGAPPAQNTYGDYRGVVGASKGGYANQTPYTQRR